MHTTYLKSASTYFSPTPTAQITSLIFFLLGVWAVVVSAIPLAVSSVLILHVAYLIYQRNLFPLSLEGRITLKPSRRLIQYDRSLQVQHFQICSQQLALSEWFIVLNMDDGQRRLVWRGCTNERAYRAFIVWLRRGQVPPSSFY